MLRISCYVALLFLFLTACQSNSLTSVDADDTRTFVTNDTIPETRDTVRKTPVATYVSKKGEKLSVKVYQTKERFEFLMQMKYKFLNEPDTLRIPNFGIEPEIVINEGADKQSCVIGFLDKKKEFKEYKLVTVANGNLKVKVLKHYFAGHYKTAFDDTTKGK